jgi:hypothetical protein
MSELPGELEPRRDAIHDRVVRRGAARRRTRRFAGMSTVVVILAVAVGLAWARSGGGTTRVSAQVIVAATTGANTARFDTVTEATIGNNRSAGEVTGSVDFTNPRGDDITRALPTPSTARQPQTDSPSAEARWIGNDIYTHGGPLYGDAHGWSLVNATKVRAASACLAKLDILGQATNSYIPNPEADLAPLEAAKLLQRVGPATIRGVPTTHWRAPVNEPAPAKSCNPHVVVTQIPGQGTVDIYTDSENRAVRIAVTDTVTLTVRPGKPQTQTVNSTTDLYDFGAPVAVQAPPAAQVADRTDQFIAILLGAG